MSHLHFWTKQRYWSRSLLILSGKWLRIFWHIVEVTMWKFIAIVDLPYFLQWISMRLRHLLCPERSPSICRGFKSLHGLISRRWSGKCQRLWRMMGSMIWIVIGLRCPIIAVLTSRRPLAWSWLRNLFPRLAECIMINWYVGCGLKWVLNETWNDWGLSDILVTNKGHLEFSYLAHFLISIYWLGFVCESFLFVNYNGVWLLKYFESIYKVKM
jgi:hypothetical protein